MRDLLICVAVVASGCAVGEPGQTNNTNENENGNGNHGICTPGTCPPGQWCEPPGTCVDCDTDEHCGPDCLDCTGTLTPVCEQGRCVCQTDEHCGDGYFCDDGQCVLCPMNDPLHCGPRCLVCGGSTPTCHDGHCVCGDNDDCEPGYYCDNTTCVPCNTGDHCGPDCLPCDAATPVCKSDTLECVGCEDDGDCVDPTPACRPDILECVECVEATHCPLATDLCESYECVSTCQAEGCTTDNGPDGETCGAAKIVGRIDAISGAFYTGDTTGDGDDDNLSTNDSDCWDAKYDNFYRMYLMVGDQLQVTLDPQESDFDAMMKLYAGIDCADNGEDDLIDCYDQAYDGGTETLSHTATADGWYTVVVDGRMAFSDDYDYGAYQVTFTLTYGPSGSCCP